MARKRAKMPRKLGCLAADELLEVISALQAMAAEAPAGPKDRA